MAIGVVLMVSKGFDWNNYHPLMTMMMLMMTTMMLMMMMMMMMMVMMMMMTTTTTINGCGYRCCGDGVERL